MRFADALAEAQRKKGPTCTVCQMLAELDEETASEIAAALDDPSLPHVVLSRALAAIGYEIKGNTVGRHRNGHR